MQSIKIGHFTYTFLQDKSEVVSLPLNRNLFGINGRIYANLASRSLSPAEVESLSTKFTEEELAIAHVTRLYEIHIHTRTAGDKFDKIESIDFPELFDFVKKNSKNYRSIYATFNDSEDGGGRSHPVHELPLGSNIVREASNYAYNVIEKLKLDNLWSDAIREFVNIF